MWKMSVFSDLEHNNKYIINSKMEILFGAAYQESKANRLDFFRVVFQFFTSYHFWKPAAL